jgi:N-acetylglucosaminyldiphosphoundecaprenol N-acetyl-beta-D-mannosaminyltransferase
MNSTTSEVFGIRLSAAGLDKITEMIVSEPIPKGEGSRLIVTANVDHIVKLRKSADFRAAYATAWIRTADGFPIYQYARARGVDIPARVTGSDLFASVMARLGSKIHRCFFIARSETNGEALKAWLLDKNFPEHSLAICVPPFGFELDKNYSDELAKQVHQHGTTHLFVGLGAPKSEIWCYRNRLSVGDCYIMCVGAGLEFFLGEKKRAPAIFQKVGMEWLWRLGQEPRRLYRRYLIASWGFLLAVAEDLGFIECFIQYGPWN